MSDANENPGGFASYESAVRWLEGHINYERMLGGIASADRAFEIASFARFLAKLGDPHLAVPSIHIAGTRGKGSSALALEALLRAGGARVATFTSPHLREYPERIRIGGAPISPEAFARNLAAAAAAGPPEAEPGAHSFKTVFEYLTAAFFLAAREARADWSVVETGLGGRLDSTNVLAPGPVLLTRIGLEHTKILGDTIDLIAAEKAAILKPGGWGVAARQGEAAASEVFERRARATGAPLLWAERAAPILEKQFNPRGMRLVYRFEGRPLELNLPHLGPFLADNLEGALALLAELRRRGLVPQTGPEALAAALAGARFPGRMERLARARPGAPEVILDGGHCPTGARAIAGAMEAHFGLEPAVAVVGMMADKDHAGFFRDLARWPGWRGLHCYALDNPRAMPAERLAGLARPFFPGAEAHPDLPTALQSALVSAEEGCRVIAAGSIYGLASIEDWIHADERKGLQASRPPEALAPPGAGDSGAEHQAVPR